MYYDTNSILSVTYDKEWTGRNSYNPDKCVFTPNPDNNTNNPNNNIKILNLSVKHLHENSNTDLTNYLTQYENLEILVVNKFMKSSSYRASLEQTYDFIEIILDRFKNLIIDIRPADLYYLSLYEKWLNFYKRFEDKNVKNRLLVSYCSDCNDNFFKDEPNLCGLQYTENKWTRKKKIKVCDQLTCQQCSHPHLFDGYDECYYDRILITKESEKAMYKASENRAWFASNVLRSCNICHSKELSNPNNIITLEELLSDCDHIKDRKRDFKYRFQELKTSILLLLEHLPDSLVANVCTFLNKDRNYKFYSPWTKKDTCKTLKILLKRVNGKFSERGFYSLSGPILAMFHDYGEIAGWPTVDYFYKYQNDMYKIRSSFSVSTKTKTIYGDTIEGLNIMLENYQYPKCKCCNPNRS